MVRSKKRASYKLEVPERDAKFTFSRWRGRNWLLRLQPALTAPATRGAHHPQSSCPHASTVQSILETAGLDFAHRFLDSMGEQADQAKRMEATLQLEVIARQAAKAQPSAALDEDGASPPSSPEATIAVGKTARRAIQQGRVYLGTCSRRCDETRGHGAEDLCD